MKKILMGVFGLGLMLSVVGVQAETVNNIENIGDSASNDVTVGNVETPVYDVDISWDNLSFNWVYNETDEEYEWELNFCHKLSENEKSLITEENYPEYIGNIYTDNKCSSDNNLYTLEISYEEAVNNFDNYYYFDQLYDKKEFSKISIIDNSKNVKITPQIEWESSENYEWTIGKYGIPAGISSCSEIFSGYLDRFINLGETIYTDSSCMEEVEDKNEISKNKQYYYVSSDDFFFVYDESEISEYLTKKNNIFDVYFTLEVDETKEIKTPKIGDTIGTITITIN